MRTEVEQWVDQSSGMAGIPKLTEELVEWVLAYLLRYPTMGVEEAGQTAIMTLVGGADPWSEDDPALMEMDTANTYQTTSTTGDNIPWDDDFEGDVEITTEMGSTLDLERYRSSYSVQKPKRKKSKTAKAG